MKLRVLAATLVALGMSLVPVTAEAGRPAPAARAGASVTVTSFLFSPKAVTVSVGRSVTWNFEATHTTTSSQGFWDSGSRGSGASFSRAFTSSGSYPYLCTIHPSMRGAVNVPVKATGSPTAGWTLRWSTAPGTGSTTFDVQVRKPGRTAWKPFETDTTLATTDYNPSKAGKYAVRARTTEGNNTSSWSPPKVFKIA
jgi:plastocyanin